MKWNDGGTADTAVARGEDDSATRLDSGHPSFTVRLAANDGQPSFLLGRSVEAFRRISENFLAFGISPRYIRAVNANGLLGSAGPSLQQMYKSAGAGEPGARLS